MTCRAWNWRQGSRTRLTEDTTRAYFLFDALPPMTFGDLDRAGDELTATLRALSPDCRIERMRLGQLARE
jgi:DNA/RNA-binding domain of Phe-tRNA-synthetase-like protein